MKYQLHNGNCIPGEKFKLKSCRVLAMYSSACLDSAGLYSVKNKTIAVQLSKTRLWLRNVNIISYYSQVLCIVVVKKK